MEDTKDRGDADAIYWDSKNHDLAKLCLQTATAEVDATSQHIQNIKYHFPKEYSGTVREAKSPHDIERLIQVLEFVRDSGSPSGLVLDPTKVSVDGIKACKASKVEENILGSGITSKIVLVKDSKLGGEIAKKTIMLAQFHGDQIRAWCHLGDRDLAPKLYYFGLEDNKVKMLMEPMEGKTLQEVLDHELLRNPANAVSLSFCVLEGLLDAFEALRGGKFTHGDLHSGNVMIQPQIEPANSDPPQIKIKLFDFDMARRLLQESVNAEDSHQKIKNDLLEIMRMFCQLYSGYDLGSRYNAETILKKNIEKEKKVEELSRLLRMDLTEEQCHELFNVLDMLIDCVSDPRQEGYGDTTKVSKYIKDHHFTSLLKKQLAVILFPERFQGRVVFESELDGMECEEDYKSVWDDPLMEEFVKNVTDDNLRDLRVIVLA